MNKNKKHSANYTRLVELIDVEAEHYIKGEINGRPLSDSVRSPIERRCDGNLVSSGICRAALYILNTEEYLEFSEYVRRKGFIP